MKSFTDGDLDQLIDEIIDGLSLQERVLIARTDGATAEVLQGALDTCIRSRIGDDSDEDHPDMMTVLWQRLRESHRLRVVK